MAANIKDEEERNRRVMLVGKFVIEHPDMSTRKTAEYFTNNFFHISNATVHDYLERYKQMVLGSNDDITQIMYNHKAKGINDEKVVNRVKLVTKKILDEDKTVEQIATDLNIGFWTVYYDLTERLPHLSNELYKLVEEKMNARVKNNLNKNK